MFMTVRKPDSRTPLSSATFGTTDSMWPSTSAGHAVAQVVVVLLRDEQGVHGGLGLDVVEREADIVLVHLVRGDLPGDEFAEQAVIGHLRFLSSKGCAAWRRSARTVYRTGPHRDPVNLLQRNFPAGQRLQMRNHQIAHAGAA